MYFGGVANIDRSGPLETSFAKVDPTRHIACPAPEPTAADSLGSPIGGDAAAHREGLPLTDTAPDQLELEHVLRPPTHDGERAGPPPKRNRDHLRAIEPPAPAPDFDAEVTAAWAQVAIGQRLALKVLSPGNPCRSVFQEMLRDARACAGLPPAAQCDSAPLPLSESA